MRSLALWIGLLIFALALTGCIGMGNNLERPRINIANIAPSEIKLFEQLFDLDLRIQNPQESALVITGLTFELEINEKPFASGVSDQTITVGRLSSEVFRVKAITSLWSFLLQVAEFQKTGMPSVTYRIKGAIYAGSPSIKLPFDDRGEIKIPVDTTK
jgi:LEA14-like dessication related protein